MIERTVTIPSRIVPFSFTVQDCPPVWTRQRFLALLLMLTKRHLANRYRGTFLGFFWSLLNPLLMMLIYTFVLSVIIRFTVPGVPYALFFLSGYLVWNLFSIGIANAANSSIEGSQFYNHIDFPRIVLPISAVLSNAVNFFVSLPFFFLIMLLLKVSPTANLVLLPLCFLLTLTHTIAFGLIFSALTPKYRDSLHFLEVLMQVWFFMTPIIYPLSLVRNPLSAAGLEWLYCANPLVGVLDLAHASLLGAPVSWPLTIYSSAFGLILLFIAVAIFQREATSFSEHL